MINVKIDFANWILKNAPDSYTQYLGGSVQSVKERLSEINDYFPDFEFFEIDESNIDLKIREIQFLLSTKERKKVPDFLEYDKHHSNGIPKAIMGKNNYIKFLQERFDNKSPNEINYWLFQGKPEIYDLPRALKGGHIKSWQVKNHKDKIKIGDKIILWQTGKNAGCYALAEVSSEVGFINEEEFELQYYKVSPPTKPIERVKIKITEYAADNPILWNAIKKNPTFSKFNAGNQGTNYRATKLEYETLEKMINQLLFTWVQTHKEIVQYLKDKESKQLELIDLLKSIEIGPLNDQNPKGNRIPLEEIEPFTFFCYLYKYGSKRRLKNLQNIANKLKLFMPSDDSGIPSTNPQSVWMYTYKYERNNGEIHRLWSFFYSAIENSITDEQFEDILNVRSVGKTKMTEGLFNIAPDKYFPINGPTKPYLKEVLNIDPEFDSFSEYKEILDQIKSITDKPFYQLSYEAWLRIDTNKVSKRNFFQLLTTIKPDFENQGFILNTFTEKNRYVWISDKQNIIGDSQAHYEIIKRRDRLFLELHFEDKTTHNNFQEKIKELPTPLTWFKWNRGGYSIRYKEYSLNESDLENKLLEGIKNFDNLIGDKIREFRKNDDSKVQINNIMPLNKILFGPPGTGKTYNTINESLQIVDPDFYNVNIDNRDALNKRFRELLIKNWDTTNGQIVFCTFHQSFSYEDFVEGIKPKINDQKEVYYEIEEGIFKKICQLADSSISAVKMKKEGKLSWDEERFSKASFYKLSLGNSQKSEDKAIYDYCIDNNVIALGYGDNNDFSSLSEGQITEKCEDLNFDSSVAQSLNYFIHYLKDGNYVIIGNGNKYVRAIAKVVGEYEYDPTTPIRYNHFRKVEWIFKDENIPIEEIYNRGLSQQSIYKIDENGLKKDFFVNQGQVASSETKKVKDYVLIIDEINRGNVSSIFGELITLIEKDKRAGGEEELEVSLPYSKEPFKVPHNVYIIGTMNTADRSIEALDTALRRRFSFKEMPPKPDLIETEDKSGAVNGIVDEINLKDLLETINVRIEKLIDKDHKIGHSYFLKVNNKRTLIICFENEIIPLLEEYFFGDYGKIGLVLGESFVIKDETEGFEFAEFEGYDIDVSSDLKERSVYKIRPSSDWDFNNI